MIKMLSKRLKLILICVLWLVTVPAQAEESVAAKTYSIKTTQMHFRTGMINGSLNSGIDSGAKATTTTTTASSTASSGKAGSISVSTALDVEFELLKSSRNSIVIRAIIGPSAGKIAYSYFGLGKRNYFKSGSLIYNTSGQGYEIESLPKKRTYWGYDVGFARANLKNLTTVFSASTSLIDASVCIGYIYQTSKTIGIEAQAAMGFGYGFSDVPATGTIMKILFGVTYTL